MKLRDFPSDDSVRSPHAEHWVRTTCIGAGRENHSADCSFPAEPFDCALKRWNLQSAEFSFQVQSDLAAVKPAVFDKDFMRAVSGNDDAGKVDSRHVRFKRFGITVGRQSGGSPI